MKFGNGLADYEVNSPEAVRILIDARLKLWQGEWFANTGSGTPWLPDVLGAGTKSILDAVIQRRIRQTQNVQSISSYSSEIDGRKLSVSGEVVTSFSSDPVAFATVLP